MGYLRDASPVYRYHILFLNTSARRIGMIWRPSLHFCNLHNDRFEDLPINYCSQWRSVASMSIISRTSHFSEQNTTKTLKNEKFKNVLPGVWYTNSKMCNFCPAFGSCFHCYFVCPGFGRKVTGAHLYPPAQGSCPPLVWLTTFSSALFHKNRFAIFRSFISVFLQVKRGNFSYFMGLNYGFKTKPTS